MRERPRQIYASVRTPDGAVRRARPTARTVVVAILVTVMIGVLITVMASLA
ncbi:MAG: hypothetical protein H0W96_00195 [Solirubrobacterales bacterium]|nr:hypothetical protein [Solirubrobacterales bacterium]